MQIVLKKKRNNCKEINISLFDNCNLRCKFCFQFNNTYNNSKNLSIDERVNLALNYADTHKKEYSHYIFIIMGGELFADFNSDELFSKYQEIVDRIHNKYPTSPISFVSNMVFTKIKRVKNFCEKNKDILKVAVSFDFYGRFHNNIILNRYMDNIKLFKNYISGFAFNMIKPSLDIVMGKIKDDIGVMQCYNYIYDNFKTCYDYYAPDEYMRKEYTPTYSDLYNFFKYMIKHYPKTEPFNSWLNNKENTLTCMRTTYITNNGIVERCREFATKESNCFNTTGNNDEMENKFLKKYNCLSCKYYSRCTMGCFMYFDYKDSKDYDDCIYKRIFEELE